MLALKERTEAKAEHEEADAEDGSSPTHLGSLSPREVLQIPPANTDITARQHNTLVQEGCIATHHRGGTGNADGRAMNAKHGATGVQETTLLCVEEYLRGRGGA